MVCGVGNNLEAALDSELLSERALQEVILDDGQNDKIEQFLAVSSSRRRRSSVSADQLLLKPCGPSLGSQLLDATLKEINRRTSEQLPVFVEGDSETLSYNNQQASTSEVQSWFISPSNFSCQTVTRDEVEDLYGASHRRRVVSFEHHPDITDNHLTSSRSLFFAVLTQGRYQYHSQTRENKDPANTHTEMTKQTVNTRKPPAEEDFTEIPSLDKVQEHIARVRTIMGQSPTFAATRNIPSSTGSRQAESKAKLTAHKVYKVPFPALKRRRDTHLAREKYLHSLIIDG